MTNYFNPYGIPYQPNYNNFQTQPIPQQKYTNKIYVSGIEGARSYSLNPNSEVILCDDTKDIIYDIIVDPEGKRTINVLDIKVHEEEPTIDMSQYATKEDIEQLRKEIKKSKGE